MDQLDKCLSHPEVWARFERYTTSGRVREEGTMSETDALEEALMDVFAGARTRGYRLFKRYAEDAHVSRLKRIRANHHGAMKVEEYLPDLVGLRARLRKTSDLSILAHLLAAEQGGRNDDNETRPEAVKLILSRIDKVSKEGDKFAGASDEELLEASETD
tara:strand:+ start:794 stop:1273 length:480 start_codon:yes stop_codon:yes gene_type:complete